MITAQEVAGLNPAMVTKPFKINDFKGFYFLYKQDHSQSIAIKLLLVIKLLITLWIFVK
ncbi:hypothetical protein AQ1688_70031 [Tenacibaculum maritimum]|nr:hypothetical protein AQ1688_70031 [Tenacibaculum maritimum]